MALVQSLICNFLHESLYQYAIFVPSNCACLKALYQALNGYIKIKIGVSMKPFFTVTFKLKWLTIMVDEKGCPINVTETLHSHIYSEALCWVAYPANLLWPTWLLPSLPYCDYFSIFASPFPPPLFCNLFSPRPIKEVGALLSLCSRVLPTVEPLLPQSHLACFEGSH